MRFFGAAVFGIMALATTVLATTWYRYFGGLLLLAALPFWLLFVVYLIRGVKP